MECGIRCRRANSELVTNRDPANNRLSPADPAMTQKQREALFDLITLATYADGHISIREEELAESAFIAEGWQSEYPKSLYLEKSIAKARAATESEDAAQAYLAALAGEFTDHASQVEAFGVVQGVISRDGLAAADNIFLSKLRHAFPKVK